jgi:hypothetical protein
MKTLTQALLTLSIVLFVITGVFAQQQQPMSPEMQAAMQLVREKKWSEAVSVLEAITAVEPKNPRAWYFLGNSYHQLGAYEKAVTAFETNIPISNNPSAMYNLACAYSRLKKTEKALEWLEKSINGGVFGVNLEKDEDLNNIRGDARFAKIVDAFDRRTRPCMYQAEYRQLDFWVGMWEVYNPQGQRAGDSIIQMFGNGCGILENWTSTLGGDGKSINYYDPRTGKWYQTWMGINGQPTLYSGNFTGGAMRFEYEVLVNGVKTINYLTFTKIDDNTVRQLGETSTDGGKTRTTNYDFKYVRKK